MTLVNQYNIIYLFILHYWRVQIQHTEQCKQATYCTKCWKENQTKYTNKVNVQTRMAEWIMINEQTNESLYKWMNEYTNEWMNIQMNDVSYWINEWVSKWMSE